MDIRGLLAVFTTPSNSAHPCFSHILCFSHWDSYEFALIIFTFLIPHVGPQNNPVSNYQFLLLVTREHFLNHSVSEGKAMVFFDLWFAYIYFFIQKPFLFKYFPFQ